MNIRIVNLRNYVMTDDEILIRLDRSNKVLGNKFIMNNESQRKVVCEQYERWFYEQIVKQNEDVRDELRRIFMIIKNNKKVAFGCWCAPKRCHTETILNYLKPHLIANDISLGFKD